MIFWRRISNRFHFLRKLTIKFWKETGYSVFFERNNLTYLSSDCILIINVNFGYFILDLSRVDAGKLNRHIRFSFGQSSGSTFGPLKYLLVSSMPELRLHYNYPSSMVI